MGSKDDGLSAADKVAKRAEGLATALEDTGESSALVWVTEGDNSNDLVLDRRAEAAGSQVCDLGTLSMMLVSSYRHISSREETHE